MFSRFTGPQRRAIFVFGSLWLAGLLFFAAQALAGG